MKKSNTCTHTQIENKGDTIYAYIIFHIHIPHTHAMCHACAGVHVQYTYLVLIPGSVTLHMYT